MFDRLKKSASQVLSKRTEYHEKAKPYIDKSLQYCKDNPSDVMLGVMTLLLWDMESDIDDIENASKLSAAVDYHNFTKGG
jgi:hypothetical protein